MGWLDRLKSGIDTKTNSTKLGFLGFVAYPPGNIQKIEPLPSPAKNVGKWAMLTLWRLQMVPAAV